MGDFDSAKSACRGLLTVISFALKPLPNRVFPPAFQINFDLAKRAGQGKAKAMFGPLKRPHIYLLIRFLLCQFNS